MIVIYVGNNPKLDKMVQKKLFKMGYGWPEKRYRDFIAANDNPMEHSLCGTVDKYIEYSEISFYKGDDLWKNAKYYTGYEFVCESSVLDKI